MWFILYKPYIMIIKDKIKEENNIIILYLFWCDLCKYLKMNSRMSVKMMKWISKINKMLATFNEGVANNNDAKMTNVLFVLNLFNSW